MDFIRGDTFPFKFPIKMKDGTPVKKSDLETLFITVRKIPSKSSKILIQKTLDDVEIDSDGYCHARFNPEDTENLTYGNYFADAEVTMVNNYRKTMFFQFELTKETTIHESGDNLGD